MKLVVPDLIFILVFPVDAAGELGLFAQEGVDVDLERCPDFADVTW